MYILDVLETESHISPKPRAYPLLSHRLLIMLTISGMDSVMCSKLAIQPEIGYSHNSHARLAPVGTVCLAC